MVKEFVELFGKVLTDKPEAVTVNEVKTEQCTVFELRVAEGEIGRVVGKKGRLINAMRDVLISAGIKDNRKYLLEVAGERRGKERSA